MTRNLACKVILALTFLASLGFPTRSSFAQTSIDVAKSESVEKAGTLIGVTASTFKAALAGDRDSILLLATRLVPAAVALAILFVGYMVASFVGRVVGMTVARNLDLTLGKFLSKMIKILIMLSVGAGVLSRFGVDVTSFAAVLAAGGFAIGMAMQGTLSNFASGVMLLVFRPFKIGDYIKIGDTEGTVDEIDLFATRLNSLDNRHLIVPNSSVFGKTIENVSHNQYRRADVNVGVAYEADLAITRRVLEQAVGCVAGAVAHPASQVYLMDLGDSSVQWQVRVWCRPDVYWDVRERVVSAVKQGLDSARISIPYPQLDLHVVENATAVNVPHAKAA